MGPLKSVVEQLTVFGVPYEAARARCDLRLALIEMDSGALGELEIQAARAEFSRLGAAPALQRLSGMLAGDEPPAPYPR